MVPLFPMEIQSALANVPLSLPHKLHSEQLPAAQTKVETPTTRTNTALGARGNARCGKGLEAKVPVGARCATAVLEGTTARTFEWVVK